MNFKKICLAIMATFIVSCEEDTFEVFDYAAQYEIEKPIIDDYLDTHYYDDATKEIKEIDDGQTALNDDENLQTFTDTVNEVEYQMYSYIYEQGTQNSPDADDLVNMYYRATDLELDEDGEVNVFDESIFNDNFISLYSDIIGWSIGLSNFKGGISNEDDTTLPRQYSGTGKGFMIIPSGLLISPNLGNGVSFYSNKPLLFKVELRATVASGEDLDAEEEE